MVAPRRWIRLDIGWDKSDWIADLDPCARLAWVLLIGYVKTVGVAGAAKALTARGAAREWRVPEESVTQMLAAACAHGALESADGGWSLTGWDRYQQEGAAERQRRYRADKSRLSPLRDTPERNVTSRPVTLRSGQTETETEKETENSVREVTVKTYPSEFEKVWKTHPRGSKQKAYPEYRRAVPARIAHDDLMACLARYVSTEINDRFRGHDLFRWIRDERWEEYAANSKPLPGALERPRLRAHT